MQGSGDARRLPWRIFWVGFLVRVAYLTLAHQYKIRLDQDHFQFGWEMGRIGRALATGYGYSDPFVGHSGPTAWTPPLYPLLIGAVFKVFGVYTRASAWVILTVNSVFSAATAAAVYEIGRRCFPRKPVALWSGWLWALYPAAMQYAVHWVWDMAVTTCLFAWILVLALRVRGVGDRDPEASRHQTIRRWLAFGALWGVVGLTNSSLLTFLPACGLWMIWRSLLPRPAATLRNVTLAAICCAGVLAPWIVRNWTVFHTFIPMRSNLGAELYQSVLPSNEGFPWGTTLPLNANAPEMVRYRALGEIAYSRLQGDRAKAWIASNKPQFLRWTLKRVYFFWFGVAHPTERGFWSPAGEAFRQLNYGFVSVGALLGLALMWRNKCPGSWLFFWMFLLIPITFYAITVQARFRHPLEPVMTVLVVYLFQSATRAKPVDGLG